MKLLANNAYNIVQAIILGMLVLEIKHGDYR